MLNYMFLYKIYHPIGWHHYGRNGSDSLSWYKHDMDFIVTFSKIHVYIWDLSSYWLAPLLSQWEWLSILVQTRYGFHRDIFQNTGLYMRFIILFDVTIIVAIGPALYHGIYTTWIFVVSFPKYSLYTSSSFCWLAPLWSQWDWLYIMAYTQHGVRCGSKIQVCKWD
jgi:hypothetical protein